MPFSPFRCALPLVLAAVALAGCGSSSSNSSSSSSSSSGNGVAAKTPDQILSAAEQAAESAQSVRISGAVSSGGQPVALNLALVNGKGASGTISSGGVGADIIEVNKTVYLKGSDNFWRHVAGAGAAQLFHGKWLKAPANGNFAAFSQFTDLNGLFQKLFASGHGTLQKGATTTIDGQKVIALTDTAKQGTLYVATTGKPYPVQLKKTGSDGGHIDFTDYNQSFNLAPPKNAVDVSKLHG